MKPSRRSLGNRRTARLVSSLALLGAGSSVAGGCLDRPIEPIEPRTTSTLVEQFTQSRVDKIDILLTIDDSRSMADKQAILATAVPDLVRNLVNPPCLGDGDESHQPAGPLEQCPVGMRRGFEPVLDINIGVISTSLGPRGSDVPCTNDQARLIHRVLPGQSEVETYDGLGFLAWDPAAARTPAGEQDLPALVADLEKMVLGVDQVGCGYEAQLESWYRFLVDPEPYATTEIDEQGIAHGVDVDGTLLAERASFLRPDSLVAIIMLSDENDCSFRAEGQGYMTGNSDVLGSLQARSECAANPQDPCCTPCGKAPPSCPVDPKCENPPPDTNQLYGLTCFDQKQRFGVDLLYPIDRYVAGLTQQQVPNRQGELVANPLLVAADGTVRPPDRVFFAGIVGVPWQDVARTRETGDGREVPDLALGLKTADELAADDSWSVILGDPERGVDPLDPHMVESIEPRAGLNPITGDRIAPPTATDPYADPINGHEYLVDQSSRRGDLQYACIFDLPAEDQIDCATLESSSDRASCDCTSADTSQNPLCQAPDGSYSSQQLRAKAYPSLRQLAVLRGIGSQAIVGSICPANITDLDAPSYGYRPTIDALTERLKERLGNPCLPRSFVPDGEGQISCIMLEGRAVDPGGSCDCSEPGRRPVGAEYRGAVVAAQAEPVSQTQGLACFCEIPQLEGAALTACQNELGDDVEADGRPVDGWCYVDGTTNPPLGNPELVAHCADVERRTVRFLGAGNVDDNATLFVTCQQESE